MIRISTTHRPASDLGFLLHKNPGRVHELSFPFGQAWLCYPEVSKERCTAVLGVEIDTVDLVRGRGGMTLDQYVNDRPYVASSYLCTVMTKFFGTAMSGRSKERPDLVDAALPLEIGIPVAGGRLDDSTILGLFEPLGYEVEIERKLIDENFLEWGKADTVGLTLKTVKPLKEVLRQIYVLMPVLDQKKHYFLSRDEVDKLMAKGEGWLGAHPLRELITRRYLGRRSSLVREALARIAEVEGDLALEAETLEVVVENAEEERGPSLHSQRHMAVVEALKSSGAQSVMDLGCGDGKLLARLMKVGQFKKILGMDVSLVELERAEKRLHMDRMGASELARIELKHGSLLYRDKSLMGYDAAALVEVIEHLDEGRLGFLEKVVFGGAKPGTVVVTTPNKEYNAVYEGMAEGTMRHSDHRFEWTREQFFRWCDKVGDEYGYRFSVSGIGEEHPEFGCSSQMGVFKR